MKLSVKKNFFKLLLLHRRIGLVVIWLVLWLAITGILLNHTDDLNLDERALQSSWLNKLYGLEITPVSQGYALNQTWLVALAQGYYLKGEFIADDYGTLVGGVELDDLTLLVTDESIVVLDQQGEVLEVQGLFHGLEGDFLQAGLYQGQPVLKSSVASYLASTDVAEWQVFSGSNSEVTWSVKQTLPDKILEKIRVLDQGGQPTVSMEKLILDLHTGRLFGHLSWIFMDIFALLLMAGAISGFVVWFKLRVKS